MKRDRSKQRTHAPHPIYERETLCGRHVAGSMELDALAPSCPNCAALAGRAAAGGALGSSTR